MKLVGPILTLYRIGHKRKYSTYLTICFFAFLTLLNSSNFTVAIVPVAKDLHTTTARAGYLTSIQLLSMGLGNLFLGPIDADYWE